ncbi:MAG: DUF6351 family protein [Alphaproteobacteria bacterium]|nr:DUF6351 family protein [Alphaproteobacteria bacterium]
MNLQTNDDTVNQPTHLRQAARRLMLATACCYAMLAFAGPGTVLAEGGQDSRGDFRIATLSTPAHVVSGGHALVGVDLPQGIPLNSVNITLNGEDITDTFNVTGSSTLTGLVTGLRLGQNSLRLSAADRMLGHLSRELSITNYPITGPITSGPHIDPFICQSESFLLPDGTPLGAPLDDDCTVSTVVQYLYLPVGGSALTPLADTSSLPANVADTTTLHGETVPFVVRVETGTVNRGIYQSVVLHDPTSEPEPTPFTPPRGWNGRLIGIQGFGCPGGWYRQGASIGNLAFPPIANATLFDVQRLGEGYASFSNTLQHPSNNCNAVLAAETAMMSKEHFIETFGVPRYAVSHGCSGGSYGSMQPADALPGLFDGVLIACTFPDPLSIALSGLDGHLLSHYFAEIDPFGFSEEGQVAVSGYKNLRAFLDAANQAGRTDPVPGRVDIPGYNSAVWNPAVPADLRYDPFSNPFGARPTVFDTARNVYGVDSNTGFALRPFDNVGVQYGLEAVIAGAITTTQFLDLNENIGGYDQDANYVASRSSGDVGAIERAHLSGLQLGGGGGMASIPVIDISGIYNDDSAYHYQWFHFATRDRMLDENGDTRNHVMWRGNPVSYEKAWLTLIEWMEAIQADKSQAPDRIKAIRNKPSHAIDGCFLPTGEFIGEPQIFSREPDAHCNILFPSYGFPRLVAGGPLAANILKCTTKPIDPADYAVAFSPSEWTRLHEIFSEGVCDWSKPGIGQESVKAWASFGPSTFNLVFDVSNPANEDSQ